MSWNTSRHLDKGVSSAALQFHLSLIRSMAPSNPVIFTDDSDIVKPDGKCFESLGFVRDGSNSSDSINVYEKGYHVTEACVLTKKRHPVSIFSQIHSSKENDFTSVNDITFRAMDTGRSLFGKATFVMDRDYDENKMFLKLHSLNQDYVIRLTAKRNLLFHNKWIPATELRNRRKGKIRTNFFYKRKEHEAYLSHIKTQITAARKDIYLLLVYGLSVHPMMLGTNKEIRSKDDVISIARLYFSRRRIEEYFRCKKQVF